MPDWQDSPQKQTYNYFLNKMPVKTMQLPNRIPAKLDRDNDLYLSRAADVYEFIYVSPFSYLCSDSSCFFRAPNEEYEFISKDSGHLSKSASIYFIYSIGTKIKN